MTPRVDFRAAVATTWLVFRMYPVVFSLPMVMTGLIFLGLMQALAENIAGVSTALLAVVGLLASFVVVCYVQVLGSAMYLRARSGERPSLAQVGEILGYRGFLSYIGSLFGRYVGWMLLLVLVTGVVAALVIGLGTLAMGSGHSSSGIGAFAGGVTDGTTAVVVLIVGLPMVWIFSRYQLVLPMFAAARENRAGLFEESVKLAVSNRRIVFPILLVSLIPSGFSLVAHSLIKGHWILTHGMQIVLQLMETVVLDIWAAWFVLIWMELALQWAAAGEVSPMIGSGYEAGVDDPA